MLASAWCGVKDRQGLIGCWGLAWVLDRQGVTDGVASRNESKSQEQCELLLRERGGWSLPNAVHFPEMVDHIMAFTAQKELGGVFYLLPSLSCIKTANLRDPLGQLHEANAYEAGIMNS